MSRGENMTQGLLCSKMQSMYLRPTRHIASSHLILVAVSNHLRHPQSITKYVSSEQETPTRKPSLSYLSSPCCRLHHRQRHCDRDDHEESQDQVDNDQSVHPSLPHTHRNAKL
jgi:hypothetical protein